jgi:hypothetical protein
MTVERKMADFLWENGFVDGDPVDPVPIMERVKAAFPDATIQNLHNAAGAVARRWHAAYGQEAERHAALIRAQRPSVQ